MLYIYFFRKREGKKTHINYSFKWGLNEAKARQHAVEGREDFELMSVRAVPLIEFLIGIFTKIKIDK